MELDQGLATRLRDRWPNVDVVEGDAAAVELPREPFRVVGNLPFDRTTAILRHLLDDPSVPLVRADVIVEWGVAAKRALPWPSTLNGVLWAAWYSVELTRRLPRTAFEPPPSVDGGVLVFRRRAQPLVPASAAESYRRFVARGFRRGLRSLASGRELRLLGVTSPEARELDAYQWTALFLKGGATGRASS